jgi:hypothetical protein
MAMHKEYIVEVKHFKNPEKWHNVIPAAMKGQQFVRSAEAAETVLSEMHEFCDRDPDFFIIESRIRVREVSDWEVVESSKVLGVSEEG